ncbi:MAG: diguanylate cyclase [Sulfuriferula sp.]
MSEFFSGQADYLFFIYGLTFVILGTVCFINRKPDGNTLSLTFLGLFGFAYGLHEWLEMLALTTGSSTWLSLLRSALMLLSFMFLLEFSRIGIATIRGGLPVGRWIFIPLFMLVVAGGVLNNQVGLDDGIRFGFGLTGSIAAAVVLYLWGQKIDGKSAPALSLASLGLACYGLTIVIVQPDTSLFSAQLPSETAFFASTGIPIQFFRAVFAGWIAGFILGYEIRKLEYPMPGKLVWLMNLGFAVLGVALVSGFMLTNYFDRLNQQNIRDHLAIEVTALSEHMVNQIKVDESTHQVSAGKLTKNIQIEDLGLNNIYAIFLVDTSGKIILAKGINTPPVNLWNSQKNGISALFDRALINGEQVSLDTNLFIVGRKVINNQGWSMVILERVSLSGTNRLFGIVMTLLVCTLILVLLVILQKIILTELALRHDHEELRKLSEAFEKQSITDTLTGAYNRLKFDAALQMEMKSALRYQTPLALIMYDIDHFKRINDTYGHQVGDKVLQELTTLVANNIRSSDMLARWGGEEFMIIVPHDQNARALAEKLRYVIASHDFEAINQLTCSFGVANLLTKDTPETFTARADDALYEAKLKGRNRVEV